MPTAAPKPIEVPDASPTVRELKRAIRKERLIDYSIIFALLPVDAYLIWALITDGGGRSLLFSLALLLLSTAIHLFGLLRLYMTPKRPARLIEADATIGRYKGSEIAHILEELLPPHSRREQPNVYITEPKYDGAYAINSLFFNFLKPLNAVFLSRHLFQTLRPGEIKAVLAHELAHFYGYIGPLDRARFSCMVCNALLPVYLAHLGGQTSFLKVLFLWFAFSGLFIRCLSFLLNRQSRNHEYLSDLSAAKRYGILNVINGLFAVVNTFEAQHHLYAALTNAIGKDGRLGLEDLATLVQMIDDQLPNGPLSMRQLKQIVEEVLTSPEVENLRKPRSEKQLKAKKADLRQLVESLLLNKKFKLLDWSRFDNSTPDGRIDEREYPQLIANLRQEPERQLFDLASDNAPLSAGGTHPTLRERILFLESCRENDSSLRL